MASCINSSATTNALCSSPLSLGSRAAMSAVEEAARMRPSAMAACSWVLGVSRCLCGNGARDRCADTPAASSAGPRASWSSMRRISSSAGTVAPRLASSLRRPAASAPSTSLSRSNAKPTTSSSEIMPRRWVSSDRSRELAAR